MVTCMAERGCLPAVVSLRCVSRHHRQRGPSFALPTSMTTARTLVTAGRRKHVVCRQTSRLLACKGRIDLTMKATGETMPRSELALKLCSKNQIGSSGCTNADGSPVLGHKLMGLVLKKLGQHAVAVGLSAALLASCLSAGASELMRYVVRAEPRRL